jgi:dTDP-glucose pyrophosphorylase
MQTTCYARDLRIRYLEEKRSRPRSNLGVTLFGPRHPKIRNLSLGSQTEMQLTHSTQTLVDDSERVYGIVLHQGEKCVEVGTAEAYFLALKRTLAHGMAMVRQDSFPSARIR